jgi:hypothetical protein
MGFGVWKSIGKSRSNLISQAEKTEAFIWPLTRKNNSYFTKPKRFLTPKDMHLNFGAVNNAWKNGLF